MEGAVPIDAFISYSHAADGKLAPALQSGLQHLARPFLKLRALRVFRDKTSLSATPHLWGSIESALLDSRYFILLASPEAASSTWVNRELTAWKANRSPERLLVAVTDGDWAWNRQGGDFDWPRSSAVPEALRGAFTEEPLYVDLRWARSETDLSLRHSRFRDAVAELAAPIHGVRKEDLESEDVRQHRKTRLFVRLGVALLTLVTAAALTLAVVAKINADRADRESHISQSGRVAAQAELLSREPDVAILLHLASLTVADTTDARQALLRTLSETKLTSYLRPRRPAFNRLVAPSVMDSSGHRAIFAGLNGAIEFWDLEAMRRIDTAMISFDATSETVRFRPDGKAEGNEIGVPVVGLAASADGSIVAAKGLLGPLFLWETGSSSARRIESRSCAIDGESPLLAFSPNGDLLACTTPNSATTIELLNPRGRHVQDIAAPGTVASLAFDAEGRSLVVGTGDLASGQVEQVTVISTEDASVRATLQVQDRRSDIPDNVAVSADGMFVVAGSFKGFLTVWDAVSKHVVADLSAHSSPITSVSFIGKDWELVSGDDGGTLVTWRLKPLQSGAKQLEEESRLIGHDSAIRAVAEGTREMVSLSDDAVAWWGSSSVLSREIGEPAQALDVAVIEDTIAYGKGPALMVIPADGSSRPQAIEPALSKIRVTTIAVDAGSHTLAAATGDGEIGIWDLPKLHLRTSWKVAGTVVDIALDPTGDSLAARTLGAGVLLFDTRNGRQQRDIADVGGEPIGGVFQSIALSPDGSSVAFPVGTRIVILDLEAPAGSPPRQIEGTPGADTLAFSPDGHLLASGEKDTVVLYDVPSLARVRVLTDPTDVVTSLAFSVDGRTLAAGTQGGMVHLFDPVTGQRVAVLGDRAPFHRIWGLAFSPNGWLASATDDGPVVWDIDMPSLRKTACQLAGRNLTGAEWKRYLPGQQHRILCAKYP
ncbi:MAG TPA: TIR domain-containing protein [Actinomycetota bacterium]